MRPEEIENMKTVNNVLTPIATSEQGIDAWKYFLASGLAFAFLDNRDEVHEAVLSRMQSALRCQHSSGVEFENAAKVIEGIQKLSIPPMDIGEALVNNAMYTANSYEEGGYVSKDVCWTAFKVGLSCKNIVDADVIAVHDPNSLKEVLRVKPRAMNKQRIDAPLNTNL